MTTATGKRGFVNPLWPRILAYAAILCALAGCTPVAKAAEPPSGGPNMIRTLGADQRFSNLTTPSVARRLFAAHAGETLSILALSGGGADGAFGAGALVGLARSGLRPQFSVVTGVSVGALIAPYAFLGPEWDEKLIEIYNAGRAEHLLQPRRLGVVFGSSLYRGAPLRELVDRYATDALIQAASPARLLRRWPASRSNHQR